MPGMRIWVCTYLTRFVNARAPSGNPSRLLWNPNRWIRHRYRLGMYLHLFSTFVGDVQKSRGDRVVLFYGKGCLLGRRQNPILDLHRDIFQLKNRKLIV